MAYTVTIASSNGRQTTYPCGGTTDQEALIYAGKVVEREADSADPDASITIKHDEQEIGVSSVVRDMLGRAV